MTKRGTGAHVSAESGRVLDGRILISVKLDGFKPSSFSAAEKKLSAISLLICCSGRGRKLATVFPIGELLGTVFVRYYATP
jgi:hypothetical protein